MLDLSSKVYGAGLNFPFLYNTAARAVQSGAGVYRLGQGPTLFSRLAGSSFILSLSPSLPLFGSKLTPRIRQVELDRSTLISSMLESHSPRLRETFTNLGRPLVDPAEDGLRRTLPSPNGIFPPTSSLPSSPKLLSNVDKLRVDSTLRLRSLETSSSRPTSTAIIWWMVDRRRTPIPNVSFALFLFLLFADFTFRRQSPSPVPTISLERTDELERLLAFPTDS